MKVFSLLIKGLLRGATVATPPSASGGREDAEKLDDPFALLERERKWIAHEIHDGLGQYLAVLRIQLDHLALVVRDLGLEEGKHNVLDLINQLIHVADDASKAARQVSLNLRSGLLDDLGLVPALEFHTQSFQSQLGIACNLKVEGERPSVPEPARTHVFRIVQEALSNVAQHAKAKKVSVKLSTTATACAVSIVDDGIGITEDAITGHRSQGIDSMKARAKVLRGHIEITESPGGGTSVRLVFPLPEDAAGGRSHDIS